MNRQLNALTLIVATVVFALAGHTSLGATITSDGDGDWNDTTTWDLGRVPDSTDTIQIDHTVAYDLTSGTFNQINVSNSGHLGYKLIDSANDVRSMHVTGGINAFKFTVGGSFDGGSIEADDDFTLTLDDGVIAQHNGNRDAKLKFQGYSTSTRNVTVQGADSSSYGQIIGGGFKGGNKIQNAELKWLSNVSLNNAPYQGGSDLNEITGSYIYDFASGSDAVGSASYTWVEGNVVENVDNGIASIPNHPKSFTEGTENNTFTGTGAGDSSWIGVPEGGGGDLKNNDVQGYTYGIRKGNKKGHASIEGNTFDDLDYGIYWRTGGGGVGASSLTSVGDVFGGDTPNTTYDLYLEANYSNFTANFDGTELNSDANPLNELYFNPYNDNDSRVTVGWLAWRDFDGTAGDYRVWSNADGLAYSEMQFAPRTTDTLTLESNNAYASDLPTTLTLDGAAQLEGVVLDSDATLVGGGQTLTLGSGGISGGGTLDVSGGVTLSNTADATVNPDSITGTGTVTKQGTGILSLNTAISGPATVEAGTLAGSADVGGLLTVEDGATYAPGNSATQVTTGALDLQSGSVLAMEIGGLTAGTDFDQIIVPEGGSVDLAGDLDISLFDGFNPELGDEFVLIVFQASDAAITGNFVSVTGDGNWQVSYTGGDGNDVVASIIPEPTTLSLLGLALTALLGGRPRRRK